MSGRPPRRFALAPKGADYPLDSLRAALVEQGWRPGRPLSVMSDGEPALPNLVPAATREPVRHMLDWFHLSVRIRPIEQVIGGLLTRPSRNRVPIEAAQASIKRIRHLLWHGRQDQADQVIGFLLRHSLEVAARNGQLHKSSATDLRRLCNELQHCPGNNRDAIINYHRRYHDKRPVSTSRAKGYVDEIPNARMSKKRRMRWSPRGAHRVAVVRAAVLDRRLNSLQSMPFAS